MVALGAGGVLGEIVYGAVAFAALAAALAVSVRRVRTARA